MNQLRLDNIRSTVAHHTDSQAEDQSQESSIIEIDSAKKRRNQYHNTGYKSSCAYPKAVRDRLKSEYLDQHLSKAKIAQLIFSWKTPVAVQ